MSKLTANAVREIVGPVDEELIARILATGASEADLLAAVAWVEEDDYMGEESSRRPTGTVARLCAILQEAKETGEEDRQLPD